MLIPMSVKTKVSALKETDTCKFVDLRSLWSSQVVLDIDI